jgi:hypothetical protein
VDFLPGEGEFCGKFRPTSARGEIDEWLASGLDPVPVEIAEILIEVDAPLRQGCGRIAWPMKPD